jgi:hypothetical protein
MTSGRLSIFVCPSPRALYGVDAIYSDFAAFSALVVIYTFKMFHPVASEII